MSPSAVVSFLSTHTSASYEADRECLVFALSKSGQELIDHLRDISAIVRTLPPPFVSPPLTSIRFNRLAGKIQTARRRPSRTFRLSQSSIPSKSPRSQPQKRYCLAFSYRNSCPFVWYPPWTRERSQSCASVPLSRRSQQDEQTPKRTLRVPLIRRPMLWLDL